MNKIITMNLLYRFGFYFIGLSLGIVAVVYINQQKNVSFDYLPNARTLKQIRLKEKLSYSSQAKAFCKKENLNASDINYVLHEGDVEFSKSHPQNKPCPDYWIEASIQKKVKNQIVANDYVFIIKRCENEATITKIFKQKN